MSTAITARLAAVLESEAGGGVAMVESGGRRYIIDLSQGWQEYRHDWRCTWRGQVVAE